MTVVNKATSVQLAFEKLLITSGKKNGHALPVYDIPAEHKKSNQDAALYGDMVAACHSYFIASIGEKYFKNEKERAKKLCEQLNLFDGIKDVPVGGEAVIHRNAIYSITCKINKPAMRLDQTKLASELLKRGVKPDIVEDAFEKATVFAEPAKTIRVIAS